MSRKKKTAIDGSQGKDLAGHGKNLQSYPKAMTIRYDKGQETEIIGMMQAMEEKTMSKAFLKAPDMLQAAYKRIKALEELSEKQQQELIESKAIVDDWQSFNQRLEAFVSKR